VNNLAGLAGNIGAVFQDYGLTTKHKLIADFQDDETWTSGAGTQADDATNFRLGTESIRITEDDGSGGLLYSDQNSVSLNLATFQSGAASDTSDYIYVVCYISDVTKVVSVVVAFSTEATYDGDPSYLYTVSSGLVTGWNYIKIKKSAFTNTNMVDWTGIQSMRVGWTSTASATAEYVSFQALYLVDDLHELILSNNTAYICEQISLITNWSLDSSCDMSEDTELGDTWKTFVPTISSFSVAFDKFWADETSLTDLGTTQAVALYTNTANAYRYDGLGTLNSFNVSNPIGDLVTETTNFEGQGELYYTALVIKDS
jgi:hypothetical protein